MTAVCWATRTRAESDSYVGPHGPSSISDWARRPTTINTSVVVITDFRIMSKLADAENVTPIADSNRDDLLAHVKKMHENGKAVYCCFTDLSRYVLLRLQSELNMLQKTLYEKGSLTDSEFDDLLKKLQDYRITHYPNHN
jgi:hypothetical protein